MNRNYDLELSKEQIARFMQFVYESIEKDCPVHGEPEKWKRLFINSMKSMYSSFDLTPEMIVKNDTAFYDQYTIFVLTFSNKCVYSQ